MSRLYYCIDINTWHVVFSDFPAHVVWIMMALGLKPFTKAVTWPTYLCSPTLCRRPQVHSTERGLVSIRRCELGYYFNFTLIVGSYIYPLPPPGRLRTFLTALPQQEHVLPSYVRSFASMWFVCASCFRRGGSYAHSYRAPGRRFAVALSSVPLFRVSITTNERTDECLIFLLKIVQKVII